MYRTVLYHTYTSERFTHKINGGGAFISIQWSEFGVNYLPIEGARLIKQRVLYLPSRSVTATEAQQALLFVSMKIYIFSYVISIPLASLLTLLSIEGLTDRVEFVVCGYPSEMWLSWCILHCNQLLVDLSHSQPWERLEPLTQRWTAMHLITTQWIHRSVLL